MKSPIQSRLVHYPECQRYRADSVILILIGGLLYHPVPIIDCCLFCIISMRYRAFLSAIVPLPRARAASEHMGCTAPNHLARMTVTLIANLHEQPNALYDPEWTPTLNSD